MELCSPDVPLVIKIINVISYLDILVDFNIESSRTRFCINCFIHEMFSVYADELKILEFTQNFGRSRITKSSDQ